MAANEDHIRLKLLFLEDREEDVLLVTEALKEEDIVFDLDWAKNKDKFIKSLDGSRPDIIISDYNLPSFTGIGAMEMARKRWPEVPFIIVSGIVGEEKAVDMLKAGATDFIVKNNLSRLSFAVFRALKEASDQLAIKETNHALRASEERLNMAIEGARIGLWDWKIGEGIFFNKQFGDMLGFHVRSLEEDIHNWEKYIHPDDIDNMKRVLTRHLKGDFSFYGTEYRVITKSGNYKWVQSHGRVVERNNKNRAVRMIGIHIDIDERKIYEHALRNAYANLEEKVVLRTQELQEEVEKRKKTEKALQKAKEQTE